MRPSVRGAILLAAVGLGLATGLALRPKRTWPSGGPETAPPSAPAAAPLGGRPAWAGAPGSRRGDDSPLATRLERDLAANAEVTRWLHWMAALEQAGPADFPRLARLAQTNAAALQLVAARWIELAPRHLFDTLRNAPEGGRGFPVQRLARVLFEEWPKRDPEAAIAALSEPSNNGLRRTWQMDAATTVIKQDVERGLRLFSDWRIDHYMPFYDGRGPVPQWAAANPRHAAEFALEHPATHLSQGVMQVIGEEWAKTEPVAALQFATSQGGQLASLLGTAALKTWAERDLPEAADWLAAADEATRSRLSPGLAEAWGKRDAAGALDWCQENLSGSTLSRAVRAIVEGVGVKQVAAVADLVAGLEPSPARAEAAVAVARQWFPSLGGTEGPSGAQTVGPQTLAWLASLDALSIKAVLDEETWSWATSDPGSMADFLLTVTNEAIGSWPATCLARQLARRDPAAALDWAARLPATRGLVAGGEAYAEWRSAQPEAATQWLQALPAEDPRREPFFQSAVRQLAYDPQARERFAAMAPAERAAAQKVIATMSSLPDNIRTRLLAP